MADSWLINGNCEECRRRKYCSTECKKHRVRHKRNFYNAMMSATGMNRIFDMLSTPTYNAHETAEFVAKQTGMLE